MKRTRAKMTVLETRTARRKDHLTLERSRVARLVKIKAGRENLPDDNDHNDGNDDNADYNNAGKGWEDAGRIFFYEDCLK